MRNKEIIVRTNISLTSKVTKLLAYVPLPMLPSAESEIIRTAASPASPEESIRISPLNVTMCIAMLSLLLADFPIRQRPIRCREAASRRQGTRNRQVWRSILIDDDCYSSRIRLGVLSCAVSAISPGVAHLRVGGNAQIVGCPTWISDIQYALTCSLQLPHLARELRLSFGDWLKLYLNFGH
jgi:hypothetical protein